jgi:hypothetical protein
MKQFTYLLLLWTSTRVQSLPGFFRGETATTCRMTIIDTMYSEDQGQTQLAFTEDPYIKYNRTFGCIPMQGNMTDQLLSVQQLPPSITDVHGYSRLLNEGRLLVKVTGAIISGMELLVSDDTTYQVLGESPVNSSFGQRQLNVATKMSVMVVRVVTRDGVGPDFSLEEIRARLFGSSGFKAQYSECSFGQLEFQDAGGMEVRLPREMSYYTQPSLLVEDAEKAILDVYKVTPNQLADKVMFCQPPGSGSWIARAGVNHWQSQFNNEWCMSLSVTMHEVGHNLGLLHSSDRDDPSTPYTDTSGYMGYGVKSELGPFRCFNGFKNHQLGWYKSREIIVDPTKPNRIQLAAFVDFDRTTVDQPVLLNIGNRYFIQYNRAKLFNIGTGERRDQVTIIEDTYAYSTSHGGLSANEEWTTTSAGGTLIVRVCEKIDAAANGGVDAMVVSIGINSSFCQAPAATPTASPTHIRKIVSSRTGRCKLIGRPCKRANRCCSGTCSRGTCV